MPDTLILERLELILDHARTIHSRLENITDANYFVSSAPGNQLYDSLITRLQAMGENFKKIDRLESNFVADKLHLDTTPITRFRDLISHHYELLDYQIIYRICRIEIPKIITTVESYLLLNR